MSNVPSCWVITDGRRGIENQALGLAEAASRLRPLNIDVKTVLSGKGFASLPPRLQMAMKSDPRKYGLNAPYPAITIGCGRQAIAPLMALKKSTSTDIFTVYIQDPRMSTDHFDLVIAPEHDAKESANVISMIGSPNRVTNERLHSEKIKFATPLKSLPTPRIAMLIGGHSKTHQLDEVSHTAHMRAAHDILDKDGSLMISTSRRTPDFAAAAYTALASESNKVWYWDGSGDNPYFAFLAAADAILVTQDSTNMLTEACATGKPVYSLPMHGKSGKFAKLYARLAEKCHVSPYEGKIEGPAYSPLHETDRIAQLFWDRYDQRAG